MPTNFDATGYYALDYTIGFLLHGSETRLFELVRDCILLFSNKLIYAT